MHRIEIAGFGVVGNVDSITPRIEREYRHSVTTLDGTLHEEILYTKTSYEIQLFNLLDGVYTSLRDFIKRSEGINITCGIPDDDDGFIYADYRLEIQSEIYKGYLRGKYFKNGLVVLMKAVNPDA